MPTHSLRPQLVAPLIRTVDMELLPLLASLSAAEWEAETIVPGWQVRDIVAHLLDTATRKLSLLRDGYVAEPVRISSAAELAALVNRLNHEGVRVYRRLSPALLMDAHAMVMPQFADFHERLDPYAPAAFPVSWAGETSSRNWFDTARELTERWHHQQQIRLAVDRPGILTAKYYPAVMECFFRALPHHYRHQRGPAGVALQLRIPGPAGGEWVLAATEQGWELLGGTVEQPVASLTIPAEIAWRIFTRGISASEAMLQCQLEGDDALVRPLFSALAIVG